MANDTYTSTVGWRDQPDGRGTFDVIKTCGGTILLLCWSSVCPNVPGLKAGRWTQWRMKLCLFLLAILGPDFIFMTALGQLNAAWRTKKKFHAKQYTGWSLRQCFLVNMGGLHVKFPDRDSSFPVDGKQLLYLVQHGYVADMPHISEDEINDRNKSDNVARAIAIIQTSWFTIESLARVIQGLYLTTLELTTLAFIFLMTACSICWWRKRMDISRPVLIIQACQTLDELFDKHMPTAEFPPRPIPNLGRTPLTFLTRYSRVAFWPVFRGIVHICRQVGKPQTTPGAKMDCTRSAPHPGLSRKLWKETAISAIS